MNKHGHYNKQSDRKRSLEKVCNEQKSLRCSWDMKGYKEGIDRRAKGDTGDSVRCMITRVMGEC